MARAAAARPETGEAEDHYRRMWRLQQMSVRELRLLLAGEAAEIAPWIESAARYGHAEAQLRLGQILLDGQGFPGDPARAFRWFTRAADQGLAEAHNMVGRCHENGWGVPVDLVEAAGAYARAAAAGHDWGEYNYANMLFDGRGVARDPAGACVWYRRAADRGHGRAMNLLARCYEEGWGVARDPAASCAWYRRSAETGYFRAQYNHASVLAAHGAVDEALAWFERACRAATPESLPGMLDGLERQGGRLEALAQRLRQDLAPGPAIRAEAPA